jgi:hypothetical protein
MSEELLRNDEPSDENEVEGHRRHMANDEPSDDAGSEDDFDAHRFRKDRPKKD